MPDGPAELVAVRFKPGADTALTGRGLAELTDQSVALDDLGIANDLTGDHVRAK